MDFFAPWCKACPKAAQKLDDLAQNYSETCDSAFGKSLSLDLDGVSYGAHGGPYNQGIGKQRITPENGKSRTISPISRGYLWVIIPKNP